MTSTYHLNASELNLDFLNALKIAYKDKAIEITVVESEDETEYLLNSDANKAQLYSAMKELEEGNGITLTVEELQQKYGQ